MTVTAEHFLDSAAEIASSGLDEMSQRNAISRAYYAAFHKTCFVIAPDRVKRNTGMHRGYIEQLNEYSPGTVERKLGAKLGAIYARRIKSDYHLNENVVPRDFSMQINQVNELVELLSNYAPNLKPHVVPHLKIIR